MSQSSGPGETSFNSASSTSALNGTNAASSREAGRSQNDSLGTAGDAEDRGALSAGTEQDCHEGTTTRSSTPRPMGPAGTPGPTTEGQGISAGTYTSDSDDSTIAGPSTDGRGYSTGICTTVESTLSDLPDTDGEGQTDSAYAELFDGDTSTDDDIGGEDGGQAPRADTSGVDSQESDNSAGDSDSTTPTYTSCHNHDGSDADISNDESDGSTDLDLDDEE